ncbi:aspartate--tRNA ligase dps1 [Marasmius tenuissimus]|nr:aspartate--tRNA ligase dps1 [Marasmius tenuissimus]
MPIPIGHEVELLDVLLNSISGSRGRYENGIAVVGKQFLAADGRRYSKRGVDTENEKRLGRIVKAEYETDYLVMDNLSMELRPGPDDPANNGLSLTRASLHAKDSKRLEPWLRIRHELEQVYQDTVEHMDMAIYDTSPAQQHRTDDQRPVRKLYGFHVNNEIDAL